MGRRKYPPLTPSEVQAILIARGFKLDRQDGSHYQYERAATDTKPRCVVTLDVAYAEIDQSLIKIMIRQSKDSREEFYGATSRTKKKLGG